MNFKIPLVEERVKRKHEVTLHLIVAFTLLATGSFLLITQFLLNSLSGTQRTAIIPFTLPAAAGAVIILAGLALVGVLVFRNHLVTDRKTGAAIKTAQLITLIVFCAFAFSYRFFIPGTIYCLIALSLVFSFLWEYTAEDQLYLTVDDKGIRLPVSSRKRLLRWGEIKQVMLKFGIITIDCNDNRLFQWNITPSAFNNEDLQQFCDKNIKACAGAQDKYVW
ncbi:MAG: hypothetical protein EOP49_01180 [Sphingobacteriales bacterium]|nr:MAG: hypothetical protein EOP49_01180 [Sphingobacteriales bacterium]